MLASRWLNARELIGLLNFFLKLSKELKITLHEEGIHPPLIYSKPQNGMCYFLLVDNIDRLGFPRLPESAKKTFIWRRMNFVTEVPKSKPIVSYYVASSLNKRTGEQYRMHIVWDHAKKAKYDNRNIVFCHIRKVEVSNPFIEEEENKPPTPPKMALPFSVKNIEIEAPIYEQSEPVSATPFRDITNIQRPERSQMKVKEILGKREDLEDKENWPQTPEKLVKKDEKSSPPCLTKTRSSTKVQFDSSSENSSSPIVSGNALHFTLGPKANFDHDKFQDWIRIKIQARKSQLSESLN